MAILEGDNQWAQVLFNPNFGLNVALEIMKHITDTALLEDEFIRQATLAYIENIYVNRSIKSPARVQHRTNL